MDSTCFGDGMLYGYAALKRLQPGTASWESCVDMKQISEKKAAGRRIDADGIMWWKYLRPPGRRAVDLCNSSRGLKWQSLVTTRVQDPKTLPELCSESGSTVKIAGADRMEKRARREAKMPSASWLWHLELGFHFLNFREDDMWGWRTMSVFHSGC